MAKKRKGLSSIKVRSSILGHQVFKSFDKDVIVSLRTKCPDKWLCVDLETADVWRKKDGAVFRRASAIDLVELIECVRIQIQDKFEKGKLEKN